MSSLIRINYKAFLPVLMFFDIAKSTLITQGFQGNLLLVCFDQFWYVFMIRYGILEGFFGRKNAEKMVKVLENFGFKPEDLKGDILLKKAIKSSLDTNQ